jgi:hypothetical protein
MRGAAIALAHAGSSSAHGGPLALSWVVAISVAVASVTIIFGIASTVARLRRPRRRPSDDDDGDFRGGGGRGGPGPDVPRGPDSDPAWWPDFERQFAAHVEGMRGSRIAQVGSRIARV